MTSAEHKLFITSFIVSFTIHAGIITFIFAGEKQSTEKKITWVKLTSYSIPKKELHKRNEIDRQQKRRDKSVRGERKKAIGKVKSEENEKKKSRRKEDKKVKPSERKGKISKEKNKKAKKRYRSRKKVKAKKKVRNEKRYSRRTIKKGGARRKGEEDTRAKSKKVRPKGKSISQARGSSPSKEEISKIEKEISSLVRSYGGTGGEEGDSALLEAYQKVKMVYAEMVKSLVEENFKIPQTMKQKKLSCIVYIRIGENGEIRHIKIERGSGDTRYDLFVLKTVRESAPFPPPPSGSEIELYLRFVNMK